MQLNVAHTLKTLGKWYLHSWVFLLWGALCAAAGAAAGQIALYGVVMAVLRSKGLVL